ncbi:uncharacterized [Tachysurus ichikawai]
MQHKPTETLAHDRNISTDDHIHTRFTLQIHKVNSYTQKRILGSAHRDEPNDGYSGAFCCSHGNRKQSPPTAEMLRIPLERARHCSTDNVAGKASDGKRKHARDRMRDRRTPSRRPDASQEEDILWVLIDASSWRRVFQKHS